METAFVFLVFIRIFVEVVGKGEFDVDPWSPLVERFNVIMKGIEENGGKKEMLDSVLIESIEEVISKDCKDGVIKEFDGPYSTDVPGVFTKMYVLSHPMNQLQEQSFWILPSVECRAKVTETPAAFIPQGHSIPQDTRNKISAPSTNQGSNQPIGIQNPASNAETTKKPENSNVRPPPPPSNPKYVIVENPDGGKMLGVVASPFKPTPPQSKQTDKSNQVKPTAQPAPSQPGREHEREDRVDPHKNMPQLQRNPLNEESGNVNLNDSPPVKQPNPLSDKTGYSKLPADGFSGSQNTGRAYPYDPSRKKETHPNTYSNVQESVRNIDGAPLNKDRHEGNYREPSYIISPTLPGPQQLSNKGVLGGTQSSDNVMGVSSPPLNQYSTKGSPYGGSKRDQHSDSSKDAANNSEMPFLPVFVNENPEEIYNLRRTFSDTDHTPSYGVSKQPVTHKDHNKDYRETSSLYDIDKKYEGEREPFREITPDNQYLKEKLPRDGKDQVNNPTYTKPDGNEFGVVSAKPKIGKDDLDNLPFIPIDYQKQSYESSMHPAINSAPFSGKENPIMKKKNGADFSDLQRTPSKDYLPSQKHKSTTLGYISEGNPNRNEFYQSMSDDPKKRNSPEKSSTQYKPSPSFHKGHNAEQKHSFNGKDSQPVQISPQDVKSSQKHNSEENESSDFSGYLDDSESNERTADISNDDKIRGKKPRQQTEDGKGQKPSLEHPFNTNTRDDPKKGKQRPGMQTEIPPKRKPLKPALATDEEVTSFIEKQRRKWREEEKNL